MVDDILGSKRPDDRSKNKAFETKPNEKPFVTPEKIAEKEGDASAVSLVKPKRGGLSLAPVKRWWKTKTKKQKLLIGAGALIGLILLGAGVYMAFLRKPAPQPAPVVVKKEEPPKESPKPTTEPSHLTGVEVPVEMNLLPVTGIMIENSPDARPQSGLKDAGVVFEAVAEGGITRFLTLFQEAQPAYVGPVRSVRPYYLQWLQGFDAAVAHVGGSPEAIGTIRSQGIKDLDQSFNSGSYQRVSNRYAPHNVYTSLASLLALTKSKGYGASYFTSFPRKADAPSATPNAKAINFAISSALYSVHYDYDAGSNSYKRSEGGRPHTDEKSGQQISPKVVIALVMTKGINADGVHTTYNTIGSGPAYFFQDGNVVQGSWSKASGKEQFNFTDSAGAKVSLNAGQTWISVVGASNLVTFSP